MGSSAREDSLISPFGVIADVIAIQAPRGLPQLSSFRAPVGSGKPGSGTHRLAMAGMGYAMASPDRARKIAISEAVERYSSGDFASTEYLEASGAELSGDCLDLATVPRCSPAEYADPRCPLVPADPHAKIRWLEGWDLASARPVWVPAVMGCYRLDKPWPQERFWHQISTGYAVHPDPREALVQGICEIIERDAIALLWLQKLAFPRTSLRDYARWGASSAAAGEAFADLQTVLTWSGRHYIETYLFDATTDIGIPTVYCMQVAEHDSHGHQLIGCGTSRTLVQAARKAIMECVQLRRAFHALGDTPTGPEEFREFTDGGHYMGARERAPAFTFLFDRSRAVTHGHRRELPDDSADALTSLVDALAAKNMPVIAVDRTSRDLTAAGLTAVAVFIPALQPMSFHPFSQYKGHERLMLAPVAMGVPALAEEELNPWPQPFM
ncbi:MAG: YcaO-like family protein [Streptosporangiaceae bacterium]|nr:YcaO-like family protein [Streptosporangiaceae bacterium]MBV9855052.1 YcaO-like family protein [Streptosporangiaceae bacterium]